MRVRDVLTLGSFRRARIVAGEAGLDRTVRWAHVVDVPEPAPWLGPDQLLLTTGYAWPSEAPAHARQLEALAARGIAGIALAVPGYAERFSDAALLVGERNALPLIELPWDVPFVDVTQELHQTLLAAQQRALERSEAIHRALTRVATEGAGVADLAHRLGELIGRSIAIEDPSGVLLAHHKVADSEDPARRQTVAGAHSPPELTDALARAGHLERIRASATPVRIPPMLEVGLGARVVCPIRVADELAGFVWIIEGDEPLSELDHRAAEHAALVAAVQIARTRELAQLEARLGHATFLSLLEAPDATPQTLERARLLGFNPGERYRVGIVVLYEALPLERDGVLRREHLAERLRRELVRAGAVQPMLGTSLNLIPFLLPESLDPERLAPALDDPRDRIVLGRAHDGTRGLRAGYLEARSLIGYARAGEIVRYEDVLVPRVLLGDAEAREAFLEQLLGPLRSLRGHAGLRDALLTYADEGFHFRRTAERLQIHPNTLRYRLERIRDATGIELDDPEIRFRVQLASRLVRTRQVP
ncbi:MAG: PucR family transcriptional regulator ligand-binding domain-containing protein [Candidatus Baltobacteraceae bacterium]